MPDLGSDAESDHDDVIRRVISGDQVIVPEDRIEPNQGFELLFHLSKFELDPSLKHLRDKLPTQLEGLVVGSMWCHTLYNQAKLAVSHFSVAATKD